MSCLSSCSAGIHNLQMTLGPFGMHETVNKEMAAFHDGRSGKGLAYAMAGRGKALANLPFSLFRIVDRIIGTVGYSAVAIAFCPCSVCLSALGNKEESFTKSDGKSAFYEASMAAYETASLPGNIVALLSPEVSTLHMKTHELQKRSVRTQIKTINIENHKYLAFDERRLRLHDKFRPGTPQ